MGEIGVGRSPALPAEPPAQEIVCGVVMHHSSKDKKRRAREKAREVFRMHNLTHLLLERDYMTERRAIIEKLPPGIVVHEGKGYDIPDSTYQRIPELEALQRKYQEHIRRYWAVEDVLKELEKKDPDAKRLVELYYFDGKSVPWLITHADETGIHYSRRAIQYRLQQAEDMLAYRLGWI